MYTREEASLIKEKFWTSFGRYMSPILSSEGEKKNWINYKTWVPQVFFKMDVTKKRAGIGIEIRHKDPVFAKEQYKKLLLLKNSLEEHTGESWQWYVEIENEFGQLMSKVEMIKEPLNIFNENEWPEIISFLKPRIIALDAFWNENKFIFEI
jgi:hypothetical protein